MQEPGRIVTKGKVKRPLKEKLQKIVNEKASKKKSKICNFLQLEHDITHPVSLVFNKDGHILKITKEGKMFRIKFEGDLVSLSGTVLAEMSLN